MKIKSIAHNLMSIIAAAALLVACGEDEPANPPPMVDCNATGPSVTTTSTASVCGQDDGEIMLDITGGTGNLTVTIDPTPLGVSFANNTFTDVEPGNYTIEITDADNCTTSSAVTVSFSAANLSYANDIDPIIQAKCSITGCHDGTQADFSDFATFQALADNSPGGVRQRVKSGDMPRQGSLTAEEISNILCWIDEGAQDN